MGHMVPEITEKQSWYEVEGNCGTEWVPSDVCARNDVEDYVESTTVEYIREVEGYGARLQAPGYMDSTEWCVFDTLQEAAQYLIDTYYNFAYDEMSDDEKAELSELEDLAKCGNDNDNL